MKEEIKYEKPAYLKKLPNAFKKYFDDKKFENKPYPPTLALANDYLLFDVFKVDKKKQIRVCSKDKKDVVVFTREKYYRAFNYDIWQNLSSESKITFLYWYYEEICDELKIYKPHFSFLEKMPQNYMGMYVPDQHNFVFSLSEDEEEGYESMSAYDLINVIAHELKHAEFYAKEREEYLKKFNKIYYFSMPDEKDYDFSDDREKFSYLLDYTLYHCQPTEVDAYNYGLNKSYEVFKKVNSSKNGKIKISTPYTDLRYFRSETEHRKSEIELVDRLFGGQENFKEYMDKLYLERSFGDDAEIYQQKLKELDPTALCIAGKMIIEESLQNDVYGAKVIKELTLVMKSLKAIQEEIDKDERRMFKEYKKRLANINIKDINDDFIYGLEK